MRIRTKLVTMTGMLLAVVSLVGAIGFFGVRAVANELDWATANLQPSAVELDRLRSADADAETAVYEAILGAFTKDRTRVLESKAKLATADRRFAEATAAYERLPWSPGEREQWLAIRDSHASWRQLATQIVDTAEKGDADSAQRLFDGTMPARSLVDERFDTMLGMQARFGAETLVSGRRVEARIAMGVVVAAFVSIVLAAVGAYFLVRSITRPLQLVTSAADRVAAGAVDTTIEYTGADELGLLADSFRRSLASLRSVVAVNLDLAAAGKRGDLEKRGDVTAFQGAYAEMIAGTNAMLDAAAGPLGETRVVLERLAAHDLTARMTGSYEGAYSTIATSLNGALESIEAGLETVAASAGHLSAAAAQIARSSESVASGASTQASALEETSASLGGMAGLAGKNVDRVVDARGLATRASDLSKSGAAAVTELARELVRIRESAEGTAAIVRDINEIAFQTNILALNAAVEAARAGDAGRSFGVVADEVRSLALRAKEAAARTDALIGQSVQLANGGERRSHEVASSFGTIHASVETVSDTVSAIAAATEEQMRGVAVVNASVAQMDTVTQQNAAHAEESARAAEELSSQAHELYAMVAKFKLGSSTPTRVRNLHVLRPSKIETALASEAKIAAGFADF